MYILLLFAYFNIDTYTPNGKLYTVNRYMTLKECKFNAAKSIEKYKPFMEQNKGVMIASCTKTEVLKAAYDNQKQ